MFDRRALASFRNTLNVAAGGLGQDARTLLHQTARAERVRVLRQQRQRAGIEPTDIVIADTRRGAAIEAAQEQVIIEYGYLREVAQKTYEALRDRSPRLTGNYQRSFVMLVDGVLVPGIGAITHDTREVVILNASPYARRLEVGKRSDGSPFVVQVRPRIVEEIAISARVRFGNMAKVAFAYFDLAAAYTLRRSAGRAKSRRRGAEIRYPGIRITAL